MLQKIHVNMVHIQLQYAGRFAEAQNASQMRLCAASVAVHKFFDVCPGLKYNTAHETGETLIRGATQTASWLTVQEQLKMRKLVC